MKLGVRCWNLFPPHFRIPFPSLSVQRSLSLLLLKKKKITLRDSLALVTPPDRHYDKHYNRHRLPYFHLTDSPPGSSREPFYLPRRSYVYLPRLPWGIAVDPARLSPGIADLPVPVIGSFSTKLTRKLQQQAKTRASTMMAISKAEKNSTVAKAYG